MDSKTLSIIAIIISIGVPLLEMVCNKYINNINIDMQYYDDVYKDFLISKIPECRFNIERTSDGRVHGIDEFISVLKEVRKRSLYFKFSNEVFYKEIYALLQELEDDFVLIEDHVSNDEFIDFISKIEPIIYNLYECIHDASHGKGLLTN